MPGQPQYVAILDKWNLAPQLPDSAFVLQIPEGVERIDLEKLTTRQTPAQSQIQEPEPADPGGR